MYFKNKEDTNIDNEFENESYVSKLFSILSKYKKIVIVVIVALVLVVVLFIVFGSKKVNNYLELNGEEEITLYQGDDYIELGYRAYNSNNEDLINKIDVESNLNINKVGEYEITYSLGNLSVTRYVKVIEKPKEYTFIYLKPVNNSVDIYLKLGEKYVEPGYKVYSSSGKLLNDKVKVSGEVNTSKRGSYQLVYSLVDSNNVTVSKVRTINVMDSEISLSLDNKEYTNKDVIINVNIVDQYFDYMILPNNNKVTNSSYQYQVSNNGTYKFIVYNKKGVSKEASIEVSNIDKIIPNGSCSGTYGNGTTTINIKANDNSGIEKYIIEDKSYTTNKIILNKEIKQITINIKDKAGNINNIECELNKANSNQSPTTNNEQTKPSVENNEQTKPSESQEKITFSYEYNKLNEYMPYALYTPSSAKKNNITPLIIWLHGSGEVSKGENALKQEGMLEVLNNWKLDGFNAYVLCPHLTGSYANTWHNDKSLNHLNNLINKIVEEKNIDTNKIIITGHSMGGQGALYMAAKDKRYSALVVYSGYYPQTPITGITIPAQGYVGTAASGEDPTSVTHMYKFFKPQFGSDNLHSLNANHGSVPRVALNIDKNNDNKSDLIEWMLNQ